MTSEEMEKAILSEIDADPEAFSEASVCTIDPNTRVITVPASLSLFGTESDEKTNRLTFRCPRVVGDNVDLSNFQICINFRNANSEKDRYIVEDMMIDGDEITFSWSLSRKVTKYKGRVSFIVCALNAHEGIIANEWNTTLAFGTVLEGLEADEVNLDEEEKDIILQLLAMVDEKSSKVLEEIEAAKNEVERLAENAVGAVNIAGQNQVNNIEEAGQAALNNISNGVDESLTQSGKAADSKVTGDNFAKVKAETDSLKEDLNNFESIVGSVPMPLYSCEKQVNPGENFETGMQPEPNHKYALVSTDTYLKNLKLMGDDGSMIMSGTAGTTYCYIEFGDIVPNHAKSLLVASEAHALDGFFYLFDVTNNEELENYLKVSYLTDAVKWYGGVIKTKIENLEKRGLLSLNTSYSNPYLYPVNTTDASFKDNILTGTFDGTADSRVSIKSTLKSGNKYLFKMDITNDNDVHLTYRIGFLNTSYAWVDSNFKNYTVPAHNTSSFYFYYVPTTDCWLTLMNINGNNMVINTAIYCYDVTDLTENEINVIDAYGYDNLSASVSILYLEYSTNSYKANYADTASKAYGRWKGKKIWISGDSITDYGWYPPKLSELLGCESYYQDGHSGGTIAECTEKVVANPSILNGYSIYSLLAGTNDFGGSKDIGTMESDINANTTIGSLRLAIETILSANPDIYMIVFTPLPRGKFDNQPGYGEANAQGKYLVDYCNAIKDVCEYYHIKCVDLHNIIGWNKLNIGTKTIDMLHPKEEYAKGELAEIMAVNINMS